MSKTVSLPSRAPRRIFIAAILLLPVILLVFYGERLKPRTWELSEVLRNDPALAAYPYQPRLVSFLNGVVSITRPYTDASGPAAFLTRIEPTLRGLPPDAPARQAAERRLHDFEQRIVAVMIAQPGVGSVDWWLDRAWYSRNGVPLPADARQAQ